jgi:hypothetical protein
MMAVFEKISVIILLAVIFFGCDKSTHVNDSNDDDQIHGSGRIATENRDVRECSGINVTGVGEIYVVQDSQQSIRVEADDNILDKVIIEEKDGILQVGLKHGSYSDITLKVYVSLSAVRYLALNGAGNITAGNQITTDNITCTIIGAGNIYLSGAGAFLKCDITGAGKIDARDFHSDKCEAVVNGAGSCFVFANESLDAKVYGIGSIFYYGNPANVSSAIYGLGLIVRK